MCFFNVERHDDGTPRLVMPTGKRPTAEQAFRKMCYMNGVTDQNVVDGLWAKEKEKLAKCQPPSRRPKPRPTTPRRS